MKKLLIGFLFISNLTIAQSSADWWFFGDKAGLNFTAIGPVPSTEGVLKSVEGCATISDEFGSLLFYTRGDTVWDSTHSVMQNGTGLIANGIAGDGSMNSFIVPRPGNPFEFYLFTIRSFYGGLYYSKIDMTLNGGLGAVDPVEKNIPLIDTTMEMMTCLRKPNNQDFWLVSLKKPGDTAFAFEITPSGINLDPVKSNTGLNIMSNDRVGYLKGSQQNDRIAMTLLELELTQVNANVVHLFDFDNVTGELTHDLMITPSQATDLNYGVEFSPNGDYLYVQSITAADTRQYDLTSGIAATINASEVLVGLGYTSSGGGAMQLGPDGKIYIARNAETFLASIEFPNDPGVLCGYNHSAVGLAGRQSAQGLPQFTPFFLDGSITLDDACFGDTVFFNSNYLNADSVFWNFGDPASGPNDTSLLTATYHVYTDTGVFTVTHVAYDAFLTDTTIIEINIRPRQSINLPSDTLFCNGLPQVIDLDQPGVFYYLWNGDTANSSFTINDTGLLEIEIVGVCDTLISIMDVKAHTPFELSLLNDTVLCDTPFIAIGDSVPNTYDVLWNTGDQTSFILADTSSIYTLSIFNTCDTAIDSVEVLFRVTPLDSLLPEDTTNCFDVPFFVSRTNESGDSYLWQDGSDVRSYRVSQTDTLILTAFNSCGLSTDTMNIFFNKPLTTTLPKDTTICDEDSLLLMGNDSLASYLWSTGDTVDSIWTEVGEDMNYTVTVTSGECFKLETVRITTNKLACVGIDCDIEYGNVFTPNGDGINDRFQVFSDCDVYRFEMYIYNRWGQLVHVGRNINSGWDGYINGELAQSGTYFFVIEYKDFVVVDADRKVNQGSFTLMR